MPRAGTPIERARAYRAKHDAKRKAQGWVRGPRITAEAAEKLRELAHATQLTPAEVVSRLIRGQSLTNAKMPSGLSQSEREFWERDQWTADELARMQREPA